MIRAELLKLRRRRPAMILVAVLTGGAVLAFQAYTQLRHGSHPQEVGPVGGEAGMGELLKMQGLYFGAIASILIGTEAATADLAAGVFRDLVATGRSRLALFWVRLPAALIISLAFTIMAYALGVAGLFAYADGLATPTVGQIVEGLGWVLLANAAITALALGVGSVTGSRALTLTGLIGWQTIGSQLIIHDVPNPTFLLNVGLSAAAPLQLVPVQIGTAAAVVVIAGWTAIPTLAGAWRTSRQDA
ncbi:MAG TPA: hypothetical protein VGH14_18780 [Solirubrobacterales bacterium]